MPVYKPENSPYYYARFECHGHRVHKSTKAKNKKEAERVEREWREQIEADVKQARVTGSAPVTLDVASGHYWSGRGQHHANSDTTFTDIQRLIAHFGKDIRLDQMTDADVAGFVAKRRMDTIKGRKKDKAGTPVKTISNATVNRSGVVLLKAIFNYCVENLGHVFPRPPKWKKHMLKEPEEIVRELDTHEAEALDDAVRDDYAPWFEFARLTGLRRNETLIRWDRIVWFIKPKIVNGIPCYGHISSRGKGNRDVSTPITERVRSILKRCEGHHKEYVFTFICKRPIGDQIKGKRYPITPEGAKTQWRRLRKRSGVQNFRFHDIRHDVGTKILRKTGNLKLVQKVLNHSNIKTTVKYAHVVDDEVAAALTDFQTPTTLPTTDEKETA